MPGLKPTSAGRDRKFHHIVAGDPGRGILLTLEAGEVCELTKKPRKTLLQFPCDPSIHNEPSQLTILKSYEGQNKLICNYYVNFAPSQLGCPVPRGDSLAKIDLNPVLLSGNLFSYVLVM